MNIVFMGGEVPSHRTLLNSIGAKHISINYWRLVKRGLPKTKEYILAERFPDDVKIYLDGGGHNINDLNMTERELGDYAADYQDFLAINSDRITMATELDAKALGQNWINYQRKTFGEEFGLDRYAVIWHPETAHTGLYSLASQFPNVALLGESLEDDTSLSARSRALLSQFPDLQFHGIACAKPDNLRQVPLATASTLSWLSPMMRGETIVWDGTRLVRYQKKQKDQARPRYKAIIERAGLDFDKIMNDDSNEVTRLAIWSYLQLEKSLNSKLSDHSGGMDDPGLAETRGSTPDNRGSEVRKNSAPRAVEDTLTLPVFGVTNRTILDKDDSGRDIIADVPVLQSTQTSFRQCNTCFVAANCPAFEPNSSCKFSLPVEVKTKDQLRALLNAIIEMQGARVAFARFAEELNGGYPDPNTGQEIDRLFKLVGEVKKLEENKEFIQITAQRQSSGGMLSALFGDRASVLREIPGGGIDEENTTRIIDQGLNG